MQGPAWDLVGTDGMAGTAGGRSTDGIAGMGAGAATRTRAGAAATGAAAGQRLTLNNLPI